VPSDNDQPKPAQGYGTPEDLETPPGIIAVDPLTRLAVLRRVLAPRDAVVKSIQVKSGQIVQKGDLLMMLSSETLEWQMIEVRGQLEVAEAKLAVLEQKRAFIQRLIEKQAAAQDQVLEIQAEVQVAQTELKTRKSQYDLLARATSELNVLAPVDGKIHAANLEANLLGNPVDRGDLLLEIISAEETGRRGNR
jgi:multidrug efflux pump subunit AcrA (membrane-fusion protein)